MATSPRPVTIVQIGVGTVGGALIEQILAGRDRWRDAFGLDVIVGAVVGNDGALIARGGISASVLDEVVRGRRAGRRLGAVASEVAHALHTPDDAINQLAAAGPVIVVDAAAGDQTATLDDRALAAGGGIVLSNKAPLALPMRDPVSQRLWAAAGVNGRVRYEATCGAGLPVFSTLRSLLDTGDEIVEIQGAVSGTLGAIFSDLAAGVPFSEAVRSARVQGYTEPDPRDDLSGLDVARKALILARTIGISADLADIPVEGLVPDHLSAVSGATVDQFLERAVELDAPLAERAAAARAAGNALRYVATVGPDGPPTVGIREVPTSGILGGLRGPENAVSFRTRRYDVYPLGISGPGAGAAVTAAGMLSDLLSLAIGPLAH